MLRSPRVAVMVAPAGPMQERVSSPSESTPQLYRGKMVPSWIPLMREAVPLGVYRVMVTEALRSPWRRVKVFFPCSSFL